MHWKFLCNAFQYVPLIVWSRPFTLTLKIGNIGACWNIGELALANHRYRFCKNTKQRATTLKWDSRKLPLTSIHITDLHGWPPSRQLSWQSAMWMVLRQAASALQRTPRRQVSDAIIVTQNWGVYYFCVVNGMAALCCRLFGVFQAANDRHWDNYRWSALFVQRRVQCWPMCVCVTVAVNAVCAGQQCMGETCVHARSTHLGHQRRSAVT